MKHRTRTVLLTLLAVAAGAVALYAAVGFLAVPYYIERKLPDYAQRIGLQASVDDVDVNPFLLTVQASGLTARTANGEPLLDASSLHADLDLSSVWQRRWIVDRAQLNGARVTVIDTDHGLNVAQLLAHDQPATPDASGRGLPPVVVENLILDGVTVEYVDRTRKTPAQVTLGPVQLHAQHLSTLAGEQGEYKLKAALPEGASLDASGSVTLQPPASHGALELTAFRLATLVPVAVDPAGYSAPSGELSAKLQYSVKNEPQLAAAVTDLRATLADFSVSRAGSEDPVVALAKLAVDDVDVDVAAHTVSLGSVQASQGVLDAFIDASGELNLARLADAFNPVKEQATAAGEPWRITLGSVNLEDIRMELADRSRAAPLRARGTVASLGLRGSAVVGGGKLEATVDGGNLALREIALRQGAKREPLVQLASFDVAGAQLDTASRRMHAKSVAMKGGAVNAALDVAGRIEGLAPGTRIDRGDAGETSPLARAWRPVAFAPEAGAHEKAEAVANDPWHIGVDELRMKSIAVSYADRTQPLPLQVEVQSVDAGMGLEMTVGSSSFDARVASLGATLQNISAAAPDASKPALTVGKLAIEHGMLDTRKRAIEAKRVALQRLAGAIARDAGGNIGLGRSAATAKTGASSRSAKTKAKGSSQAGAAAPWHIRIASLAADTKDLQYVDRALPAPLRVSVGSSKLSLALDAALGGRQPTVSASKLRLRIDKVQASALDSEDKATIGSLLVENGRLDTAHNVVGAQRITVRTPSFSVVRRERGLAVAGIELPSGGSGDGGNAHWRYQLGTLKVQDGDIAFADETLQPALAYDFDVDATLSQLDSGARDPARFQATVAAAQGGQLQAQGTFAHDFSAGAAQLHVDALPLGPLDAILKQFAAVDIASGTASVDAHVRYDASPDTPLLVATGAFSIDDVLVNEAGRETRVLQWKRIDAQDAKLTISPNLFEVDEMRLAGPEAQLIVSEKRTLNITRVLKEDDERKAAQSEPLEAHQAAQSEPPEVRKAAQSEPPTAAAVKNSFPVHIGRLSIRGGTLDFADRSLVLPFSTRVHALRGVVVGLSTAPGARAALELQGEIADYGAASARGSLEVTAPTRFMDVTAQFDNVRLPPLSPYTATFAGRTIESGRMWLVLDYRILDHELSGENKVVLQNFELGKRVEAPGAMDLPLELAVSLLKDSKGRISMAIPVSGNVGDPHFDYGAVISKAIGSALRKIVTAPFRALASLFGGKTEQAQLVQFEPGSARITPSEEQQLGQLAQALKDRPGLQLVVRGPYDPERDARVLREEEVRRAIAGALGRRTPSGRVPADPVAYTDPETQTILENMLKARMSAQEYDRFVAQHPNDNRTRYEAAFDALARRTDVSDTALRALAARRARAIAGHLAQRGVDPSRIAAGQIGTETGGTTPSVNARLDLQARASP